MFGLAKPDNEAGEQIAAQANWIRPKSIFRAYESEALFVRLHPHEGLGKKPLNLDESATEMKLQL